MKKSNVTLKVPYISIEVEAKSSRKIHHSQENYDLVTNACDSMKKIGIECDDVYFFGKTVSATFAIKSSENFSKNLNTIKRTLKTVIEGLD